MGENTENTGIKRIIKKYFLNSNLNKINKVSFQFTIRMALN